MFGRLATTGGLSIKVLSLHGDISLNPFESELPYTGPQRLSRQKLPVQARIVRLFRHVQTALFLSHKH